MPTYNHTGELRSYRVFPCLLGPVFPIDLGTANEMITGVGVDSPHQGKGDVSDSMWDKLYDNDEETEERAADSVGGGKSGTSGSGGNSRDNNNSHLTQRKWDIRCTSSPPLGSYTSQMQRDFGDQHSTRLGFPSHVLREVRTVYHLVAKMCARYPWLDPAPRSDVKPFLGFATPRTSALREKISSEYSHRVVNTLLSVYSQLAVQYCEDQLIHVPLAYPNRDR